MSTDIAPSVTAEYTATVPVADDGEPFDHAAEVQALLPILNRVEFLRQFVGADFAPTAANLSEQLRDTFFALEEEQDFAVTVAGYQFQKTETGANTYDPISEEGRPGVTEFGIATGNANNRIVLQEAFTPMLSTRVKQMYLSIRSPDWSKNFIWFGMFQNPSNTLGGTAGFYFEQTAGLFRAYDRASSASTQKGSASPSPVNGESILLGFRRSGTSIIASYNDTDLATFTPADTSTELKPGLVIGCNGTGGATLQVDRWLRRSSIIAWGT